MVFKRRDRRGVFRILWEVIYPRGGWVRAYEYVKHRLRRLPGTPEAIARGVAAGVFVSFTPLFGMHFVVAALLALVLRGSILAAILGTFFGNPLTYIPIMAMALGTGYFLLGIPPRKGLEENIASKFGHAASDLWHNAVALFTDDRAQWDRLIKFWDDVFFPWLIGGIIPGIIFAVIAYYLSVPLVRVYQNRRKGRLAAKLAEIRDKLPKPGEKKDVK